MTNIDDSDVRRVVHEMLKLPAGTIGDDEDLLRLGLDSLSVMRLAGRWTASGVKIAYADLVARPTLAAWVDTIERARVPRPSGAPGGQPQPIRHVHDQPFRLAPMQQAYWIGRANGVGLGGVNAHYYVELDGMAVDPGRLEGAIDALQRRHEMLRARFLPDGNQCVTAPEVWNRLVVHDFRDQTPAGIESLLAGLRDHHHHLRMDVERGETFSVALTLLPGGNTRLHINIDMLVADATSFRIILDELAALYEEPARALKPLTGTFADYLEAERTERQAERERAKNEWNEALRDLSDPPRLPVIEATLSMAGQRGGRRDQQLDSSFVQALSARARRFGVTVPTALCAAFAEVVAQWSTERRFILNLPVFDRRPFVADVDLIVGDFTNVSLIDVDLTAGGTFIEQAVTLQMKIHRAVGAVAYSGVDVLRDLARERGVPVTAPVVFTSAIGLGDLYGFELRRALGEPVWTSSQTPQVSLDCQVTDRADGWHVNWDFVEDLFLPGVIDGMFAAYIDLLKRLADDERCWTHRMPALLPVGQLARRATRNDTAAPLPEGLLHSGFFHKLDAAPAAPAFISSSDGIWTYEELGRRVLAATQGLLDHGVGTGDLVAISLPPGGEQIVACLAVLGAGAAYLPVGLDQPRTRRERIWELSGATRVITTDAEISAGAPERVELLGLDLSRPCARRPSLPVVDSDSLAYVIYTSGSTGRPKGVEISHRAALNTIVDVNRRIGLTARDRILGVSSTDFDLSVWDQFGTFAAGASLVAVDACTRRDPDHWAAMIARHGITVWNSVPALLEMLLSVAPPGSLATLRAVLISGDRIPLDLPARLRSQVPGCRFLAMGGATEAAIWSNLFEVDEVPAGWQSIPYGFPLANQHFRVVDTDGRDRPDWVPGEMWIGGAGVARCYRGDPVLSRQRFVDIEGRRWYTTGDLGRYWPDGTLEFLGRADRQVKVRGHRIELGEIDAALERHPAVKRAFASVVSQQIRAAVAIGEDTIGSRDLVKHLEALLPDAMIPRVVLTMPELPLMPNGKVDGMSLAIRLASAIAEEPLPTSPEGPLETRIAAIWSDVLGGAVRSRDRTFFDYGGDSLLAARVILLIRERIGTTMTLGELLTSPTVGGLARLIEGRGQPGPILEEGAI